MQLVKSRLPIHAQGVISYTTPGQCRGERFPTAPMLKYKPRPLFLALANDNVGHARDVQSKPGRLDFPNLKISLFEASAQTWIDWHDDFVIKGNNGESSEKNGSLTFLSPNRTTELGRIDFFNLGIFKLAFDESDAAPDAIKRVAAELYCERMDFQ